MTRLEREALQLLSEDGDPGDDDRIWRLEKIVEALDSRLKELKLFDEQVIDVQDDENIEAK